MITKHIYQEKEYDTRYDVIAISPFVIMDHWEKIYDKESKVIGKRFYYLDLTEEQKASNTEAKIRVKTDKLRSECFAIINRGKLWYDGLNSTQLQELNTWYKEILDLPDKPLEFVPTKPSWIK